MSSFLHSLAARTVGIVVCVGVCLPLALPAQTPTLPGVPTTQGNINSVVGTHAAGKNLTGPVAATSAKLNLPSGVAFDSAGNLYIADSIISTGASGWIYKVTASNDASNGTLNLIGGNGSTMTAPNGSAAVGSWASEPTGIAVDSAGNVFFSAAGDFVVDEIPAGMTTMQVYAGTFRSAASTSTTGDGGAATSGRFFKPTGIAFDKNDNLYVADTTTSAGRVIRMISKSTGNISTIAGSATAAACTATTKCGDGGPASAATFKQPQGIAVDADNNVFIVDTGLSDLRVIYRGGAAVACLIGIENPTQFTFSGGTATCSGATSPTPTTMPVVGNIYTVAALAGACQAVPCGDGGLASAAGLDGPNGGITFDASGNIYINDLNVDEIRKIDASTGKIGPAMGAFALSPAFSGDGGPALSAHFGSSAQTSNGQLAFDAHGNLFLADTNNFNIRAAAGIGPVPLLPQTVTFSQLPNVIYGASPITLNATADSSLPITYTVGSGSPATITGSVLTITGVGTVSVTASQAGNSTYAPASVTQTFSVNQATLTVTATNISQPQGTALPNPLPYTIAGLAGTDTTSGAPALTVPGYTISAAVGAQFTIQIAQGQLAVSPVSSQANYVFSFVPGQLTVGGGSPQTIAFPALPATITYGDKPIALAATSSAGLPITYTTTGSGVITGSASAGWFLNLVSAGSGTVTASQNGNSTYSAATPATQVFTVNRALLTVTASSLSQPFGTTLPLPLQYTVTGLVGSDSVAGAPVLTTAYTTTDPVGTNDQVAISQGTLAVQAPGLSGNYSFSFVPGNIRVTLGPNTLTLPPIPVASQTYGSMVTLNAKASSGLPVSYSVTGNAALTNNVLTITGLGPITVTASQAGNANYAAAQSVSTSFTATQATLTVTVGYYTRAQGATNQNFTATISGFMNGDANTPLVLTGAPIITTTATAASPAGQYPITPALGTLFSNNYKFAFVPGLLIVTGAPSYTISASPNALTIPIGQSRQSVFDIHSTNAYQGSISFSCGQVPIGITCTFSPATVNITYNGNPNNTPQDSTTTLTVSTGGQTAELHRGQSSTVMAGWLLFPGGLAGLFFAFQRKRLVNQPRLRQLLVLIVLLSSVMGMAACGSSNNSLGQTPMGNSTLLITATGAGTPNTGSQNNTNILYFTVDVVPLQ